MAVYTNGNLALKYNNENKRISTNKETLNQPTMVMGEKLFYLFCVLFIVSLASIVIAGYAQIAKYNYSIQQLESSIKQNYEQNDQLQLKIAELSSPDRIIEIAQNDLGMALNEQQVIVLAQSLN